jgi:hypothetical protein
VWITAPRVRSTVAHSSVTDRPRPDGDRLPRVAPSARRRRRRDPNRARANLGSPDRVPRRAPDARPRSNNTWRRRDSEPPRSARRLAYSRPPRTGRRRRGPPTRRGEAALSRGSTRSTIRRGDARQAERAQRNLDRSEARHRRHGPIPTEHRCLEQLGRGAGERGLPAAGRTGQQQQRRWRVHTAILVEPRPTVCAASSTR